MIIRMIGVIIVVGIVYLSTFIPVPPTTLYIPLTPTLDERINKLEDQVMKIVEVDKK